MTVGLPRVCRAVRGQMEGAEERREVEEGGKGQAGIKLSPKLQAEKKTKQENGWRNPFVHVSC